MQIADYIAQFTGRTLTELFPNLVGLRQIADGTITIAKWDASLGDPPTADQIAEALSAPDPASVLIAYASAKASSILATVKAYGTAPAVLLADRTAGTLADLLAIRQDAATTPDDPVQWLANDGSVTGLTANEVSEMAPAVAADRKAIYAAAAGAVSAINAGTITTTAQIDALAWPE